MRGTFYHTSELAWSTNEWVAKRLRRTFIWVASIVILLSWVIPFLPVAKKMPRLSDVPPLPERYAKFIFEKHAIPKPKPVKLKPVPKPKLKSKPKAKPVKPKSKPAKPKPAPKPKQVKPKPTPKSKLKPKSKPAKPNPAPKPKQVKPKPTPEQMRQAARKKVEKMGLFGGDLPTFSAPVLGNRRINKTIHAEPAPSRGGSAVISTANVQGSGGIGDIAVSAPQIVRTHLADRQTTVVASSINESLAREFAQSENKDRQRSDNSIRLVFDRLKGRQLNPLYQRALRKNPSLKGRIVFEITITPGGKVEHCEMVSSELHVPALEKRLVARIKTFDFGSEDVLKTTVNYPIEFAPRSR